jgi:integrase
MPVRAITRARVHELLEARPGPAADAVKLRLLLGQRGGEVIGMRWSEVDLQAGTWTLPGSRTYGEHEAGRQRLQ